MCSSDLPFLSLFTSSTFARPSTFHNDLTLYLLCSVRYNVSGRRRNISWVGGVSLPLCSVPCHARQTQRTILVFFLLPSSLPTVVLYHLMYCLIKCTRISILFSCELTTYKSIYNLQTNMLSEYIRKGRLLGWLSQSGLILALPTPS